MNSIILLTKLQLAQTIGGVRAAIEKHTGANGAMAGAAIVGVIVFVGIAWLGYAAYGFVGAAGVDTVVFDVLFLACGVLTFALSLPAILGSFFGSSDINDLLPLPVSPFAIVFSKALGAQASAYLYTFLIVAAPLAGWGVAAGADVGYWVAYALVVVFAPCMPIAYAGTISIIAAALFKRVRRKDSVTTIATVLTLGASLAVFFLSRNMDASADMAATLAAMSDTLGGVVMTFPAYGFAVHALASADLLSCALFVLISAASFAVFVVVARVLYLRTITALSSGSGRVQAYAGKGGKGQSSIMSTLVHAEVRKVTRNSSVLLYYVAYPLVFTPIALAGILSSGSMESLGVALAGEGDATSMVAGFGLSTFMFLAAVCMMSNRLAGTCISREGSNWAHMKYIPVPMITQIRAKVLPGFVVNVVLAALFLSVGGYFLVARLGVDALVVVCGGVLVLGAAWLMTCAGAYSDSRNPYIVWGNDGDVDIKVLKRSGILHTLLVGVAYAALPMLASPLTGLDPRVLMPGIAIAGLVVAVVLGHVLLGSAARNVQAYE